MPKSRALVAYTKARRRWREADAEAVLAALDASGDSTAEFAKRHGLDVQRLHFWRRTLRNSLEIRWRRRELNPAPSRMDTIVA